MKKIVKKVAVFVLTGICALSCCSFAGCSGDDNSGFNIIPAEKTYEPDYKPMSGAILDADMVIDGKFEEDFYSDLQWIEFHKIDGTQTATVNMTVRIGENGILIAATVTENTLITYNEARVSASNSGLEFYVALGGSTTWADGLYEIDIDAGEKFNIRKFLPDYYESAITWETAPVYAVIRDGDLMSGECTGYAVELFLPYGLLGGETYRYEEVYVNPTHLAVPDWNINTSVRNWYNFGARQSSLYSWDTPFQGYTFDWRGAVINHLVIEEAEGGSVTEEWGYDWTVTGDTVNLNIVEDEGYALTSLLVNGEECIDDVVADTYSFTSQGNTTVVPLFTAEKG